MVCRNSIPPTTTMENFKEKLDSAREKCWIDVGFWGGVIPGNQVRKAAWQFLFFCSGSFIKGKWCHPITSSNLCYTFLPSLPPSLPPFLLSFLPPSLPPFLPSFLPSFLFFSPFNTFPSVLYVFLCYWVRTWYTTVCTTISYIMLSPTMFSITERAPPNGPSGCEGFQVFSDPQWSWWVPSRNRTGSQNCTATAAGHKCSASCKWISNNAVVWDFVLQHQSSENNNMLWKVVHGLHIYAMHVCGTQ